jgi:Protein of unknown function (DUF1559)
MADPTFKQQCPSCEAMISIKKSMIGKKVECTKCKDKFIAERPDDEDEEVSSKKETKLASKKSAAVTSKTPAAAKRPKVEIEEEEELEIEVEDDDEKPAKGKSASNGKAKSSKQEEDEGEKDTKKPKTDKTGAGSKKLVYGLGLAVVGVALLALAAVVVMPNAFFGGSKGGTPAKDGSKFKPKLDGDGDKDKDDKKDTKKPVEDTKPTEKAIPLTDEEAARLTNLLPGNSEHVFHVNFKDLFAAKSTLREAAFDVSGALDPLAAVPMLGFSMLDIDDVIVAEKYTSPGWKYTVIHFSEVIRKDQLIKALQLEKVKIAGEICYRTTKGKTNPYFEQLARVSFGVPNHLRYHEARSDKETYIRTHNPQTLIIGDQGPVSAFMQAKEKFPVQSGKDSKDSVDPKPNPGARDDTYLTIKPDLKMILDRLENRSPDGKNKVLLSSATDMKANIVEANIPNFVARRPRQFWDVSILLYETKPRIVTLGTSLVQRDTLKYQLRNELTCAEEVDAKEFQAQMIENTSPKFAKFVQLLMNHEIRLPTADKKDSPAEATTSQITVNCQLNKVDFVLDLVLDDPTLARIAGAAALKASTVRGDIEAALSPSQRHALANGVRLLGQHGLTARDIAPGRFPPGAFRRDLDPKSKTFPLLSDQEPKNRISWMAALLPHLGHENLFKKIQFNQSWRDPGNWVAGNTIVPQFLDPMYPDYTRQVAVGDLPLDFAATHYVGVAGVGRDAAYYKRGDPATAHKRGVFSYDGSASIAEIQEGRGTSNTIMIIQVPHDPATGAGVSPWIAGGGATITGVPEKNSIKPFVLTTDRNDKIIMHDKKRGTFVVMTDGSVRFIDQDVSDEVFKAMCTINGPTPKGFDPEKDANTPLIPSPKDKAKEPTKKSPTPQTDPEKKDEPKDTPKTSRLTPAERTIRPIAVNIGQPLPERRAWWGSVASLLV